MRYVLHIGTNKTGTSTLQAYLGTHRKTLLEHGICYPLLGSDPLAHHELAEAIKLQDLGKFALIPTAVTNPVVGLPYNTVLFSSENFHTIMNVSSVANLFPPDETLIVLYVREHVRYLASWYQQDVQEWNVTCSFNDFVDTH